MRRGSGKHQSAGEALGTGSRSVAMLFIFARQSRGILMRALAEAGVHAGGQGNARFAKTVAESVGGLERRLQNRTSHPRLRRELFRREPVPTCRSAAPEINPQNAPDRRRDKFPIREGSSPSLHLRRECRGHREAREILLRAWE